MLIWHEKIWACPLRLGLPECRDFTGLHPAMTNQSRYQQGKQLLSQTWGWFNLERKLRLQATEVNAVSLTQGLHSSWQEAYIVENLISKTCHKITRSWGCQEVDKVKYLSIPSHQNTTSLIPPQWSTSFQNKQQFITNLFPGAFNWAPGSKVLTQSPILCQMYMPLYILFFIWRLNNVNDFTDNEVLIKEPRDRIRSSYFPFI